MPGNSSANTALDRLLQRGLRHHRSGNLSQAEECYRRILARQPGHPDALQLLGVIAQEHGNYAESVQLIRRATQLNPNAAHYHANLGNSLKLQGAVGEAIESYKKALALDASNQEVRHSLACVLSEQGHLKEAAEMLRQVLATHPRLADAHYHLGNVESRKGNLPTAADCYRHAIAIRPDCFEFHFNLAGTLYRLRQLSEAAESYRKACRLKPEETDARYSLGVVLQESGQLEAAEEAYLQALKLDPDHARSLANLGLVLTELGQFDRAECALQRSIALKPDSPEPHCNLGKLHHARGNAAASIDSLRKALAIEPGHPHSLCSLGFHLELLGDFAAAARCHAMALQHHPDFALARFNLALARLAEGNFAEGWRSYEARWDTPQFLRSMRSFSQPRWQGEPIQGQRILVFSEQGLGDTLQFARYIPMISARGGVVSFEVQPGLRRLFQSIDGVDKLLSQGESLPEFEWQCPLLSLPLAFGTDLTNIPACVPYLKAPEEAARSWSERIGGGSFRVGIVWSGSPSHTREQYRSIPARSLAQLSRVSGTTFYSLQKGHRSSETEEQCADLPVVNLDAHQSDFADTAAIIANLDLVISIDTSVAHLAGAMGKPVWILLHSAPDWRWLRCRDTSPWYPTARLFRQSKVGQWQGVLDRIATELELLVRQQSSQRLATVTTNLITRTNVLGTAGSAAPAQ